MPQRKQGAARQGGQGAHILKSRLEKVRNARLRMLKERSPLAEHWSAADLARLKKLDALREKIDHKVRRKDRGG